jgi:hypothetical protein
MVLFCIHTGRASPTRHPSDSDNSRAHSTHTEPRRARVPESNPSERASRRVTNALCFRVFDSVFSMALLISNATVTNTLTRVAHTAKHLGLCATQLPSRRLSWKAGRKRSKLVDVEQKRRVSSAKQRHSPGSQSTRTCTPHASLLKLIAFSDPSHSPTLCRKLLLKVSSSLFLVP